MPEARDDAAMHRPVIQRRSSVRAVIFDGIEVPLRAKNGDIAFAHFELAAGAFRNLCSTGETDSTCCRSLHRASALLYVKVVEWMNWRKHLRSSESTIVVLLHTR